MKKQRMILEVVGVLLVFTLFSSGQAGDNGTPRSRHSVSNNLLKPVSPGYMSTTLIVQDLFGVSRTPHYVLRSGDLYAAYSSSPPRVRKSVSVKQLKGIKHFAPADDRNVLDRAITDIQENLTASWWTEPWHLNEQPVKKQHADRSNLKLSASSHKPIPVIEESGDASAFLANRKHDNKTFAGRIPQTKEDDPVFERYGENAFSHKGVRALAELLSEGKSAPDIQKEFIRVVSDIADADRILVQVKITEAALSGPDEVELSKARDQMHRASKCRRGGELDRAVHHYRKAWLCAVKAEEKGSPGSPGHLQVGSIADRAVEFAIGKPYPNPSGAGLAVRYSIAREARVTLRIYDVVGRSVRTLVDGKKRPGYYSCEWDGKNGQGERVSSGIYLCRLAAGPSAATTKVVMFK